MHQSNAGQHRIRRAGGGAESRPDDIAIVRVVDAAVIIRHTVGRQHAHAHGAGFVMRGSQPIPNILLQYRVVPEAQLLERLGGRPGRYRDDLAKPIGQDLEGLPVGKNERDTVSEVVHGRPQVAVILRLLAPPSGGQGIADVYVRRRAEEVYVTGCLRQPHAVVGIER